MKRNFNFYSILSLLFLIGFVSGNIFHVPYKYVIKSIYEKDYQKSMYKCDNAMRNQFIAKAKVIENPDPKTAQALEAAEITEDMALQVADHMKGLLYDDSLKKLTDL